MTSPRPDAWVEDVLAEARPGTLVELLTELDSDWLIAELERYVPRAASRVWTLDEVDWMVRQVLQARARRAGAEYRGSGSAAGT